MVTMFHNIKDFWRIVTDFDKKYVVVIIANIAFAAMAPFPSILLSKQLFDALLVENAYMRFAVIAGVMVLATLLFNYLSTYTAQKRELNGQILMYKLNDLFNKKSLSLSYEQLSNPKTQEMRELAAKAVEGSIFIDMSRYVIDIFKNFLIILGVAAVMFSADILILGAVLVAIAINTYANSIAKRVQYENSVQVVPYMRKIDYIRTVCTDIEHGKEVRINNYKNQLLAKVNVLNQAVYSYLKKILNAQFRGAKVSQITSALQNIVVYLILGIV